MFRCGICYEPTKPGEKMTRVVVETRRVQYFNDIGEVVGNGIETVQEIAVGNCCKDSK